MPSKDELIVRIGADIDELKKELRKAGDETDKFATVSKQATQSASNGFTSMGKAVRMATVKVGLATTAILGLAKVVKDNVLEQDRWAKRLGVSIKEFSALAVVAKRFGGDIDTVGDAIKDLNERIADANRGNKTYGDALKIIGLNAKDLINIPVEEQFIKVADAIGKLNNVGDQNFVTAELMADAGFRLLEVFRLGETELRKMTQAVKDSGKAIDDEAVASAKRLDKAFANASSSVGALSRSIVDKLEPAITIAVDGFADLIDAVRDFVDGNEELAESIKAVREEAEKTNKKFEEGKIITTGAGVALEGATEVATEFGGEIKVLGENAEASAEGLDLFNKMVEKNMKVMKDAGGFESPIPLSDVPAPAPFGPEAPQDYGAGAFRAPFVDEEAYQESLNFLSDIFQEALDKTNEHEMSLLDIKRGAEEQKTDIVKKNETAQAKIREFFNKQSTRDMQSTFKTISTMMNTENRKMFEVGKAFAIADATMDTFKGANKALGAFPPPINFAMAGAVVASGIANVQKIASTQMGGGGGASAGGATTASTPTEESQASENVIDATFNLQTSQGFVSTDQIRSVADGLNEYMEDGGRLRSVTVN